MTIYGHECIYANLNAYMHRQLRIERFVLGSVCRVCGRFGREGGSS